MAADSSPPRKFLGFAHTAWSKALKEGGTVLLGQLGVAVIGLVGLRVITGLADRAVFGEVSLLTGAISLGRNIFIAPVTNVQIRYHAEYEQRGQLNAFTALIARYAWLATLAFGGAGVLAFALWRLQADGDLRPLLLPMLALFLVADSARTVRINWLGAQRLQGRVAAWQVSDQALTLALGALGILAARQVGHTTELYLAGQALGSLVAVGTWGFLFYPKRQTDSQPAPAREEILEKVRTYGAPFIMLAVVSWLMNLGDRFALGALMSADKVGSYVAAYSIASRAVTMPQGVLAGFARTILFQAEGKGLRRRGNLVFALWLVGTVLAGAAICALLGFAGDLVAAALLDERYRADAASLFVWIGVGHVLFGVTQVIENRLLSLGISRSLVIPAVAGGAANMLACFVLIPMLGPMGAAISKVVAFGTNCFMVAVVLYLSHQRARTRPQEADARQG